MHALRAFLPLSLTLLYSATQALAQSGGGHYLDTLPACAVSISDIRNMLD